MNDYGVSKSSSRFCPLVCCGKRGSICFCRLTALIIVLIIASPLFAKFDSAALDDACRSFEKNESECAVVILEPSRAKIEYIYNNALARDRRFPPGSLAKAWTASLLVERAHDASFDPSRKIICKGRFYPSALAAFTGSDLNSFNIPEDEKGERYYKCSVQHGHGAVELHDALSRSCNLYFLESVSKWEGFYDAFVSCWSLDRDPVSGARFSNDILTPFQRAASAIGEGSVRVSPLKTAQCFAALFARTPLLVPTETGEGSVAAELPLSLRSREMVMSVLTEAVRDGTLKNLSIKNRDVRIIAGKTGTATQYRKKFASHGWNAILVEFRGKKFVLVSFVMKGIGSKQAAALSAVILNAMKEELR
jgi:cell division protein FtsI/penicillin-binding protein 2